MDTILDLLNAILASEGFQAAVVTGVITALGFVGNELRKFFRSRTSAEDFATLEQVASIVVNAIEQTYVAVDGPAKKAAALETVQSILASKGVKVDLIAIEAAIEAAVRNELDHSGSGNPGPGTSGDLDVVDASAYPMPLEITEEEIEDAA